jgi:putative FmdB family regulatory protein
MPIYEFRCTQCGNIQEFLLTTSTEQVEMKCGACQGDELERILSQVSYAMGSPGGDKSSPCATTKTCGPGRSCTTLELPGHSK